MPHRDAQHIHDQWLAVRARLGEAAAMEELIRRWEPRLLYFLRRLTGSEADACDVLQQTWMKVMRSIDQLHEPAAIVPWLYRVARTTALNHARTRENYRRALAAEPHGNGLAADIEQQRFDDAEAVHWGLSQLSVLHREALTLCFLEDMPQEQIAAVLGIPLGTVKSRLHHAKAALRSVLEGGERP